MKVTPAVSDILPSREGGLGDSIRNDKEDENSIGSKSIPQHNDMNSSTAISYDDTVEVSNGGPGRGTCECNLNLIHFHATSDYPSDRGLYSDTITNDKLRCQIIKHGPCKPQNSNSFLPNSDGRKFSSTRYITKTKTGINVENRWLSYSPSLQKAYCHVCWLFAERVGAHYRNEWINGVNDWGHLSQQIERHVQSSMHILSSIKHEVWCNTEERIDKEMEKQILQESNFWYQVLRRLVDIIFTLASSNLAFRGHREEPHSLGSGNFLSIVQLLAVYDPILKQVFEKPQGSVRYLSPAIQNELISLLGTHLRQHLLSEIRDSRFFAIIGDTTTDISKVHQYSNCLRYVHIDSINKSVTIRETFLGFYPVSEEHAEGITNLILNLLAESGIKIERCYGQGYDRASVMSGIYTGAQWAISTI